MSFIKKVLVLKQVEDGFSVGGKPVSGICRVEKEDGVTELHLTVVNCAPTDGEFYLFIIDSNRSVHTFSLGKRITAINKPFCSPINPENGFAVGLCALKNDIPLTVAFAVDELFNCSLNQFKKTVADRCIELRRIKMRKSDKREEPPVYEPDVEFPAPSPIKPVYPPSKDPDPTITPDEEFPSPKNCGVCAYDDEAVATENYYQNDFSISQRLKAFEELDYERIRLENDSPFNTGANKTEQITKNDCGLPHETDLDSCRTAENKPSYYQTVRKELTAIFEKFPCENALEKIFCDSKFVKINYSQSNFYVVGVIKTDGKEKYICYGVPGKYSPEPPPELKGYCTFIPLSIFNLNGDGYWMMFQDAENGRCLSLNTA